MAMDIVDMFVNTSDEYLTGYFYARRPKTPEDGRVTFKYKQLDPNARVFDTVLGNVRSDSATYAIKTNDHCGFNVGGYIVTQNGLCWTITEVITNEQVDGENAVLRWFTGAKNAECSVRMLQVDSLFAVGNAYYTHCMVTAINDLETDMFLYGSFLSFYVTIGGEKISQNEIKTTMYESGCYESFSFPVPMGKTAILTLESAEIEEKRSFLLYIHSYQTNQEQVTVHFKVTKEEELKS